MRNDDSEKFIRLCTSLAVRAIRKDGVFDLEFVVVEEIVIGTEDLAEIWHENVLWEMDYILCSRVWFGQFSRFDGSDKCSHSLILSNGS